MLQALPLVIATGWLLGCVPAPAGPPMGSRKVSAPLKKILPGQPGAFPVNAEPLLTSVEYKADSGLRPVVFWRKVVVGPGLVQAGVRSSLGSGGPVLSAESLADDVMVARDPLGTGPQTALGQAISPQLGAAALRALSTLGMEVYPPLLGAEVKPESTSLTWVERIVGARGLGGALAPLARQTDIDGIIVIERLAIETVPVELGVDANPTTRALTVDALANQPLSVFCGPMSLSVPRLRLRASAVSAKDGRLVAQIDEARGFSSLPEADRRFVGISGLPTSSGESEQTLCADLAVLLAYTDEFVKSRILEQAPVLAASMVTDFAAALAEPTAMVVMPLVEKQAEAERRTERRRENKER